jgi:hypothetical protein
MVKIAPAAKRHVFFCWAAVNKRVLFPTVFGEPRRVHGLTSDESCDQNTFALDESMSAIAASREAECKCTTGDPSRASRRFTSNVFGALVFTESHELGMAQMVVASPLEEFELSDEPRL